MGNIRDLGPHHSPRGPIYPERPPLYRIIRNKYSKINNLSIYQHGSSTAFWVTDKITYNTAGMRDPATRVSEQTKLQKK